MMLSAAVGHAAGEPKIQVAATGDNGNGHIDSLTLTFTAPMNKTTYPLAAASSGQAGLFVEGYKLAAPSTFAWDTTGTALTVGLEESSVYDTDAKPNVVYTALDDTLKSAAGGNAADSAVAATDKASPVLVRVTSKDLGVTNVFKDTGDKVNFVFSEPVTLAGASQAAMAQWLNLEKLIAFTKSPSTPACLDGTGVGAAFNFPQPNGSGAPNPISMSADGKVMSVTALAGDTKPTDSGYLFWSVPVPDKWCKLGIDASNTSLLSDRASPSNFVSSQNRPAAGAQAQLVHPDDIVLVSATTDDTNADGALDALRLNFDQAFAAASIDSGLPALAVTNGAQAMTVDSAAIGATPNQLLLHISGAALPTNATPHVAYAKPATCGSGDGAGFRGDVGAPIYGVQYSACVGGFSVDSTDGAAPAVLSAATRDANSDGRIDSMHLTFSEPLGAGAATGWSVRGVAATGFAMNGNAADIAFAPAANGDTDDRPHMLYTHQVPIPNRTLDANGVEVANGLDVAPADGAAPSIASARVEDTNHDGSIDRAVLVYSEPVTAAADAGDFTVGGVAATSLTSSDAKTLVLAVPEIDGTDSKAIAYAPGATAITDAGSLAAAAQSFEAAAVTDAAAPVGSIEVAPGAPIKAGTATISVTYTEPMKTDAAPAVTLGSTPAAAVADASHTNGWRAGGAVWDGNVTIASGDCAVATGCAVTIAAQGAKDLAANDQAAAATLDTLIDTVAPDAPSVTGFMSQIAPGETVSADTINMFTDAFSVSGSITAGNAPGGVAHVRLDGTDIASSSPAIGDGAASVTATTTFDDRAALQAAVSEGAHALSLELCDAADNCTASAGSLNVTVDYTPVGMTLGSPTGGDVVAGNSTLAIAWVADAATDLGHVELQYSTDNGGSYTAIDSAIAEAQGTRDWTVPAVEAAQAVVRALTVDAHGNKAYDASDAFAIDSAAPVVHVTAPAAGSPFVAPGATTTVRWTATDASIDRVADPMTIEFSTDSGKTWAPIDGGTYSHANDGEEDWTVPAGKGFDTYVRVKASDASSHSTTVASSKLARGVSGYVADRSGHLYGFGTAPVAHASRVTSGDWVRGIATRADGTGGYVLGSTGLLYPFSAGTAATPATPGAYNMRTDRARGVVLYSNTSGYTMDAYGRVYRFGGAPAPKTSATLRGPDARGIVLLPNHRGGYVMDRNGRLYPFALGSNRMPSRPSTTALRGTAAGLTLRANGTSGWVLDATGRMYRFGGAPTMSNTGTSRSAYAKSILAVTDDGGYWLDGRGVLHRFGAALGAPSTATLASNTARGASM
jgi:hypothetical protein